MKETVVFVVTILISGLVASSGLVQANMNNPYTATYKIGVIAPDSGTYAGLKYFIQNILEPGINAEFSTHLIRDRGAPLRFNFIVRNANMNPSAHQKIVEEFHTMGIDMFIGGLYSDQAEASLQYVNDNDMLMVSFLSTSTALCFDDNFFRLCPSDLVQGPVIAELLNYPKNEHLIAIYVDDVYGNGLYDKIIETYDGVAYPFKFNPDGSDIPTVVQEAALLAETLDGSVCVELICTEMAAVQVINEAEGSCLMDLTWFGCDGTALSQYIADNAPAVYDLHLYSTYAQEPDNDKYDELDAALGGLATYYYACAADTAYLLARTVEIADQKSQSIKQCFLDSLEGYDGYSGTIELNEYGDRSTCVFDVLEYYETYVDVPWRIVVWPPTP